MKRELKVQGLIHEIVEKIAKEYQPIKIVLYRFGPAGAGGSSSVRCPLWLGGKQDPIAMWICCSS